MSHRVFVFVFVVFILSFVSLSFHYCHLFVLNIYFLVNYFNFSIINFSYDFESVSWWFPMGITINICLFFSLLSFWEFHYFYVSILDGVSQTSWVLFILIFIVFISLS